MRLLMRWAAFSAITILPTTAYALPAFYAESGALSGMDSESHSGNSPQSADANAQFNIFDGGGNVIGEFTGTASSAAGQGVLKASGRSTADITNHQCCLSGQVFRSSGSIARFSLDDIVISGPGATVDAVLNLSFTGTLSGVAHHANILGSAGGHALVTVNGNVNGQGFSGGAQLDVDSAHPGQLTYTDSGILSGYRGGPLPLQIALSNLPVGVSLGMTLELGASALATYFVGGTGPNPAPIFADLFSDFANSLSFATAGPVFTLANGFTVNSTQGLIENNAWVGEVTGVPSPAALVLLGFGLLALGTLRRQVTA